MKRESHLESYREHKETIFDWALKIKGLKSSQRIVGVHASRGIVDLLAAYLLQRKLIDSGVQINHRWFKSKDVEKKLPEFANKKEIVEKMMHLEILCEDLTYGTPRSEEKIKEAILLFNELESVLKDEPE
jgi:hypothetical protein